MKDVDFFLLLGRRIQQYRASYAERKSVHDKQQAAAADNAQFLQPVLKAEVGFAEDDETLQLWEMRLNNVTATRKDYEEWFREDCKAREANLGTVASFFAQPLGECNQLYWDLAILIFDPQSLNEMLAILFPRITQTLSFDASCTAGLPPTEDNVTLEPVLTQGVAALEDIQQPLQITHLTRLLIAGNTLLDLGEIQHFGLITLAKCIAFLKEHYPQLHRLLRSRNHEFDTALDCVASLSDRGMTLHEALTNFMNDLEAGAVEVTGKELEAAPVSEYAPGRFHSFLNALPKTRHQEVLQLGTSLQVAYQKQQRPLTIGVVLDRLTYGVNQERCVSQAKRYLEQITHNPKNSEALTQSTALSVEQAAELRRRYFNKPHNVNGLEATFVMPLRFAAKVAGQLTLRSASDITEMMLAAHHTQYALFMSRFQGNIVRAIKALKQPFRDGMFTCEQRFALFTAIAGDKRYFLSSSQGEIDPQASPEDILTKFVMPSSFFKEALDSTPDGDATAFMECFSPLAQQALAGATTAAFSEPTRAEYPRLSASNFMALRPSAICRLLAFHPPAVRFELINRQLSDGQANYRNCLDWLLVAAQRDVLRAALALFSDEQRVLLLARVPSLVCSRVPEVFNVCSQTEKEWLFERSLAVLVNWVSTCAIIDNIENLLQSITPAQVTKLIDQLGAIPLSRLVEIERAFTSTEWLTLIQAHVQQYRLGNNTRKQFLTPTLIVCVLRKLNGDQTAAWLATPVTSNTDTIADRIAQSGLATWHALEAAALPAASALLRKKKPLRRQVVCWDDIVASYDLPEDECFALFDADRDAAQQLVAMLRVERHLLFRKNNMRFWRHMVREHALIGKAQALYYMLIQPRQVENQCLEANVFASLPGHEQLLNDVQCFDFLLQQYWQRAAEYLLFHTPAQRLELFKKSKLSRVKTPEDYLKICKIAEFGIDPMDRQDTINQFFAQVRLADAVTWVDIKLDDNEQRLIQQTINANLHHLLGCAPESVIEGMRASMIKAIRANNLPLLRHYLFYLTMLEGDQKRSAQFGAYVANVVLVGKVNHRPLGAICYEFADEMGVLEHAVIENNACTEFLIENRIRPDALAQVYALNPKKYFAAR